MNRLAAARGQDRQHFAQEIGDGSESLEETLDDRAIGVGARMKEWFEIALDAAVVRRALKYAAVVGAILIAINHGDAILKGDVHGARIFKMALTVTVPYLVSTFSSVGALRGARAAASSLGE